jgi:predicted Zn-dependent protease
MIDSLEKHFCEILPPCDFASLRYVRERDEVLSVRQNVPEPMGRGDDAGAMITLLADGGMGYAATSDLSKAGLAEAARRAAATAKRTAGRLVEHLAATQPGHPVGEYAGPEEIPWASTSPAEKFDFLRATCEKLKIDDRIVDWEVSLLHTAAETLYLTSEGGRVHQSFSYLAPSMSATANAGAETQTRTFGSLRGQCKQGGLEVLDACNFKRAPAHVAEEAITLLTAENCPTGTMSLLLGADQMMLQIHESIGHPLEIDRILGDERNYAGTSFVTPEMFGQYRYGSELLNVTFDPTNPHQFASYGWDDDGTPAEKQYIIRDGILQRGLGSPASQTRSGLDGVANARANLWNRPPIDRMANLNVEPGTSTLAEMIAGIEFGVYMQTNRSWSIDDSRNKFQFGCEFAQLIENGKITRPVKNPNYRGISATFWRNLRGVGVPETVGVFGTPYCGKGEPNQIMRVGHASPACLFADVDVFGGE